MKNKLSKDTLREVIKQFIINHIIVNPNNFVKSSNLHYYFCILHNLNQKSLSSHSFIPLFLNIYEELYNSKLQTKSLRLKKGADIARYIEGVFIKAVPTDVLEQLLNNSVEFKLSKNDSSNDSMLQKKYLETKEEATTNEHTNKQSNSSVIRTDFNNEKIKPVSIAIAPVTSQKFNSYKKIKDWLKTRCEYTIGENTFVYILKEDFATFVGYSSNMINNKSFINHLVDYSLNEWPNSNIKKEDKIRKTNTSYIMNLKLKS